MIVSLSPVKLFIKILSVKRRLIKSDLLKIRDNGIDLLNYYDLLGMAVSSGHFYSKIVLHGCGTLPLWILISMVR